MGALSERYDVLGLLATGGMASVLYGRLKGPVGFQREVAIKRLHPHFAREPQFLQMFIDEAHICARLSHANIVSAFDVIETPPDLCLVMEYIPGAGLDVLLHATRARGVDVPLRVVGALLTSVLHGLHAAHQARDDHGESLGIVHRDVSPSNVLVGEDGIVRVLDFGIARAVSQLRNTPGGELKGKFSYMAPELLRGDAFDQRLDLYAAAVVLWEVLAGRMLYGGQPSATIMRQILESEVAPPSRYRADLTPAIDRVVMRGLARDPDQRFQTAREFAAALERECGVASQQEINAWMHGLVGELLARRATELRRLQRDQPRGPTTLVGDRSELDDLPTIARTGTSSVPPEPPLDQTLVSEPPIHAAPSVRPPTPTRKAPAIAIALLMLLAGVAFATLRDQPVAPRAPVLAASAPREQAAPVAPPALPPSAPLPIASDAAVVPGATERTSKPRRRARAVPAPVPKAAPVEAPDDCAHAVQLETVNGVVVKTYKPECLK
jgi:serine/threonine-protein kinase